MRDWVKRSQVYPSSGWRSVKMSEMRNEQKTARQKTKSILAEAEKQHAYWRDHYQPCGFGEEIQAQLDFWRMKRRVDGEVRRELERLAKRDAQQVAAWVYNKTLDKLAKLEVQAIEQWNVSFLDLADRAAKGVEITMHIQMDAREMFKRIYAQVSFNAYYEVLVYAESEEATAEELCKMYLAAAEAEPSRVVFAILMMRQAAARCGKAEAVSDTWFTETLAGCVAARVSLKGERRDRKSLRQRLAETGDSPTRRLLQELPAEVLDAFQELARTEGIDSTLQNLSNEALNRIRRVGASSASVSEERHEKLAEKFDPADESAAFEEELKAAQAAELLQQYMDKANLSDQERETFLAFGELSGPEVAEKLGRPHGQVRQEKHRAIEKLRRAAGL